MKKFLILFVLILCVAITPALLAVPAQAAPTIPTITVSVKAPADWTEVYLYLADDYGNYYHYEWPGAQMTTGLDGWRAIEVPYGYTTVIANNGTGGEQTIDLKMDGYTDAWIKVIEYTDSTGYPHDAVVSCPDADEARSDKTKPLNALSIVGTGIPGVNDWDPADPNGNMNKISDTVYSRIFSFRAGDTILFKFVGNNYWNSEYNYGSLVEGYPYSPDNMNFLSPGGGSRFYSYAVDHNCNLRFTVDLHPLSHGANPILKIEETYDDPDSPPGMPAVEYVSVFANVPSDWNDVRIWAWDGVEVVNQDSWPGTMTMTSMGNGWFTARLPGWFTSVMIIGNGGNTFTPDIVVEEGRDIWINAYIDSQSPVLSYDKVDIPCSHENHTPGGLCVLCRDNVPHDYGMDFRCPCGEEATDFTTVYFKNTDAFSNVYALWTNSPDFSQADGIRLSADENGIYACRVPTGMNYLVFSNGAGTNRVANLIEITDGQVVFRASDQAWITYDQAIAPEEEEQSEKNIVSEETAQPENKEHLTVILISALILTLLATLITTIIVIKRKKH